MEREPKKKVSNELNRTIKLLKRRKAADSQRDITASYQNQWLSSKRVRKLQNKKQVVKQIRTRLVDEHKII